jgi:paraquat-inducible protein A
MGDIIECYGCGIFIKKEPHDKGVVLRCPRCNSKIAQAKDNSFDSLYYAISSLLLFGILNIYPLISLSINDTQLNATLFGSVKILLEQNFLFVAVVVLFTIVIAPLLSSVIIILVFVQKHTKLKFFTNTLLHDGFHFFEHWSFVEVFILSVIVTYIKLAGMISTAIFDVGFYVFLIYLFCFYMANVKFKDKNIFEE